MRSNAGRDEMKRYAVYKSASAPASRVAGSVALAIVVIAFVAKRIAVIDADVFVLSLFFAGILAFLAVLAALLAFHRIWSRGGPGVPSALGGLVLGGLALGPPVLVAGMLIAAPADRDLSTNRLDPPGLVAVSETAEQPFLTWATAWLAKDVWPFVPDVSEVLPHGGLAEAGGTADIVPRRYRIAPGQLHVACAKALDNLNWAVVDELPPDLLDAATRLQAQGATALLGLKFDIALRVRPDRLGALLDVRAHSATPLRELSGNADRIRTVFDEIDKVLLETYGDLARLSVEEEDSERLEPDPVEPPVEVIPLPGFKPYFEEDEELPPGGPEVSDLAG